MPQVSSFDLLLFGGTGDLAMRKLLPALYYRHRDGDLPPHGRIVGLARPAMHRDEFVAKVKASFENFVPAADVNEETFETFAQRLDYIKVEANTPDDFDGLARALKDSPAQVRACSSCPPRRTCSHRSASNLAAAGLVHANSRVVLEKPLGHDLASAAADQRRRGQRLRRAADLPHRPLPRQGDGAEPARAALRQRAVRAAVEPRPGSATCRSRSPRQVGVETRGGYYDQHRRAARHGAEPPAAAAVHRRDGAAGLDRRRTRCATKS